MIFEDPIYYSVARRSVSLFTYYKRLDEYVKISPEDKLKYNILQRYF